MKYLDIPFELQRPGAGLLPVGALWAGALVAGALWAGALAGCGPAEKAAAPAAAAAPVAVRVQKAQLSPVIAKIEASATLEAQRRVLPGSKILGRVGAVPVREGDAVAAGQLLARLESRDLEAAIAQARAAVAMAEAQQASAAAMARRMRELKSRGSATEKNLEDAETGEKVAAAGLAQAQANLDAAKVMLSYSEVRSPLAGWVVERRIEAGDMAAPGQPMFVIEDLSILEARAEIPESAMAGLAVGTPATVRVDAVGRSYETTLARLVPAGDTRSRSFEARFRLNNDDGALRSGYFARVELAAPATAGSAGEALLIPAGALRERGQLRAVFVAEGDKARLRFVKVGRASPNGELEILSGLAPGELFLPAPPATLVDGAAITITEGN